MSTNSVCTLGGSGNASTGFSNDLSASLFNIPIGVAYDAANKRLLVADYNNQVVRSVNLRFSGISPSTLPSSSAGTIVSLQSMVDGYADTTGDSSAFYLAPSSVGSCAGGFAAAAQGTSAKLSTYYTAGRVDLSIATKVGNYTAIADEYTLCARWSSTGSYTVVGKLTRCVRRLLTFLTFLLVCDLCC